jgi:hypothetical protein
MEKERKQVQGINGAIGVFSFREMCFGGLPTPV